MNGERILQEREIRHIRERLAAFYEANRRDLPWRAEADPWATLVSEVMSQQTRIETVIPYYRAWMERFPTPAALAAASEEEVLALWKGLGYYSRARRLHQTARELVTHHGGRVPRDPEALRALPGIGAYTAGAVASIAHGVPVPAVDGNVRRVLARLLDLPAPSPALLAREAGALVDPADPGRFNQALMELGSLVCTPRSPACTRCPIAAPCRARAEGTQEARPRPIRRAPVPVREEGVAVLLHLPPDDPPRLLLRRRPDEGLLARMWEFPGEPCGEGESPAAAAHRALAGALRASGATLIEPASPRALPGVDHLFSHLRIEYRPHLWQVEPGGERAGSRWRWVGLEALELLPLPVAQQRIANHLEAALPECNLEAQSGFSSGARRGSPSAPDP